LPQCSRCQIEVASDSRFCPNCGARLLFPSESWTTTSEPDGTTPRDERPRRTGVWVAAAALVVVALLIFVTFSAFVPVTSGTISQGPLVNCPTNTGSRAPVSELTPNYDVQEIMIFTQSYSQLEFNVTAVAQCDANGYGPSYLLNGLTNTGYWYQVGLDWDWPLQSGGYVPGFGFVSEGWAPGGLTGSPASTPFSGTVNRNDTVQLSLTFRGSSVIASAHDLNTSASASTSYPANRANTFVGLQAQESRNRFSFATRGYFTGLMTEWYHVSPGGEGPGTAVTYSEVVAPVTSAVLGIGEWNFTASNPTSVFSGVANGGSPLDFSGQPNQLQQFTYSGLAISADAYEFVTGT